MSRRTMAARRARWAQANYARQRQAVASRTASGPYYVYLVTNGTGVSKVGIGDENRIRQWQGRGWTPLRTKPCLHKQEAYEIEQAVLARVRSQGWGPVMPPGFDGATETFPDALNPWVAAMIDGYGGAPAPRMSKRQAAVRLLRTAAILWALAFALALAVTIF